MAQPAESFGPVTRDSFSDERFMKIHPSLVVQLRGNMAAAGVLVMIQYRARVDGYRRGKYRWWRVSQAELAEDTGLSRDQVKRLLNLLVDRGVVVREFHPNRFDPGDRTLSYRILYADGGPMPGLYRERENGADPHVADSPNEETPRDGAGTVGNAHVADPPNVENAHVADPPRPLGDIAHSSYREEELEEGGGARGRGRARAPLPPVAAPPSLNLFPTQCERHQSAPNDDPCHGCRRARIAWEATPLLPRPEVRCPVHGLTHPDGAECRGCAADRKAAS